jgi:predicted RecB family endonuclease
VLLPANKRMRTWEVQVEVEERVMRGLVRDRGLRGFLAL